MSGYAVAQIDGIDEISDGRCPWTAPRGRRTAAGAPTHPDKREVGSSTLPRPTTAFPPDPPRECDEAPRLTGRWRRSRSA